MYFVYVSVDRVPSAGVRDNKFFIRVPYYSFVALYKYFDSYFLSAGGVFWSFFSIRYFVVVVVFQLYSIRFLFILLYINFDTVIFIIEFHFIFNLFSIVLSMHTLDIWLWMKERKSEWIFCIARDILFMYSSFSFLIPCPRYIFFVYDAYAPPCSCFSYSIDFFFFFFCIISREIK